MHFHNAQDEHVQADLTHRIRNLEQENAVLKRYLAAVPADLDKILEATTDDLRIDHIASLRHRLARLSHRIEVFAQG